MLLQKQSILKKRKQVEESADIIIQLTKQIDELREEIDNQKKILAIYAKAKSDPDSLTPEERAEYNKLFEVNVSDMFKDV